MPAVTQKSALEAAPTQLYIGGEWRDSASGQTFTVHDPATGRTIAEVADGTIADGRAALDAAVAAQADWAKVPPRERSELLRSAFELINERAETFAMLMTLEMGKPLAEARGEVKYGNEFFRWFAEEAVRIHGRYAVAPDGATRLVTTKQPVGPTFAITPWNFPLAMGTRKIGPALAAGCTIVVKPAHETPLTMLLLAKTLDEVGVPSGVLNVITTSQSSDVSEPIIRDPRLRKLTFTGSTGIGKKLVEQSSEQLLRLSMELGGNAPFVVFEDADLDKAVEGAMLAKMRNIGEACTAANRFIVHASVAEEFGRRFAERMGALTVGKGTGKGVDVGPLITEKARTGVAEMVDEAVAGGATVLTGGEVPTGKGWFYPPTVITGVSADARVLREEIFGPVAPIITFTTEEQAVELANSSEYGLVGYVFTQDNARVIRVAEALEFGMVGVNQGIVSNPSAPFGGVKHSGYGREGGFEGIEEYLETKYIGIAL